MEISLYGLERFIFFFETYKKWTWKCLGNIIYKKKLYTSKMYNTYYIII